MTPDKWLCCSVLPGCIDKQLFANMSALTTLQGGNMSVWCLQLFVLSPSGQRYKLMQVYWPTVLLCSCLSVQVKWMTLGWTFPLRLGVFSTLQKNLWNSVMPQKKKNQNVTLNSDELAFVWGCDQDRLQTLSHLLPLCSVQNVFRLFGSMPFLQTTDWLAALQASP